MANHGRAYGMSAELEKKAKAKYDPRLEAEAKLWIEQLTGESIGPSLAEGLKSGVLLCKAMNVLQPGSIPKINENKMPFKQMENIGFFLKATQGYGVLETDNFQTVDLFEAKNMNQVVDGIHALGRAAQRHGFRGPVIGVKEAESHPRNFDESVLKAGDAVIGLQAGYTGGASQSGMNFGLSRQIAKP